MKECINPFSKSLFRAFSAFVEPAVYPEASGWANFLPQRRDVNLRLKNESSWVNYD